jgi:hypothetical protein
MAESEEVSDRRGGVAVSLHSVGLDLVADFKLRLVRAEERLVSDERVRGNRRKLRVQDAEEQITVESVIGEVSEMNPDIERILSVRHTCGNRGGVVAEAVADQRQEAVSAVGRILRHRDGVVRVGRSDRESESAAHIRRGSRGEGRKGQRGYSVVECQVLGERL